MGNCWVFKLKIMIGRGAMGNFKVLAVIPLSVRRENLEGILGG